MIDPKYLQELITFGMSIEIAPSDVYMNYKIVIKKEQKHPTNSTIIGTITYEQLLPFDKITDIDRNTDCVKFMMSKVFGQEELERKQQKKLQ